MSNASVHITHCCVLHGCKFGDEDCPVVLRKVKQEFLCENCEDDYLSEIPNPDHPDYDVLKMSEHQLREEVVRLREQMRKEPRYTIVTEPETGYALRQGAWYARIKELLGYGAHADTQAEAVGYLVIQTALKGPFVVLATEPEPEMP